MLKLLYWFCLLICKNGRLYILDTVKQRPQIKTDLLYANQLFSCFEHIKHVQVYVVEY